MPAQFGGLFLYFKGHMGTFQFSDGTTKAPAAGPGGRTPEAVAFCIQDIQDYIKTKVDSFPKEERLEVRLNYVAGAALYAQVYMETMPEPLQLDFMEVLLALKQKLYVVKMSDLESQEHKA